MSTHDNPAHRDEMKGSQSIRAKWPESIRDWWTALATSGVVTSVEEERQMMVVCSTMAENNKRLLARFGDLWFRDLSGGRASVSPPSDIGTMGRSDRQILIPLHLRNELSWLDGHQQCGTVCPESEYFFDFH